MAGPDGNDVAASRGTSERGTRNRGMHSAQRGATNAEAESVFSVSAALRAQLQDSVVDGMIFISGGGPVVTALEALGYKPRERVKAFLHNFASFANGLSDGLGKDQSLDVMGEQGARLPALIGELAVPKLGEGVGLLRVSFFHGFFEGLDDAIGEAQKLSFLIADLLASELKREQAVGKAEQLLEMVFSINQKLFYQFGVSASDSIVEELVKLTGGSAEQFARGLGRMVGKLAVSILLEKGFAKVLGKATKMVGGVTPTSKKPEVIEHLDDLEAAPELYRRSPSTSRSGARMNKPKVQRKYAHVEVEHGFLEDPKLHAGAIHQLEVKIAGFLKVFDKAIKAHWDTAKSAVLKPEFLRQLQAALDHKHALMAAIPKNAQGELLLHQVSNLELVRFAIAARDAAALGREGYDKVRDRTLKLIANDPHWRAEIQKAMGDVNLHSGLSNEEKLVDWNIDKANFPTMRGISKGKRVRRSVTLEHMERVSDTPGMAIVKENLTVSLFVENTLLLERIRDEMPLMTYLSEVALTTAMFRELRARGATNAMLKRMTAELNSGKSLVEIEKAMMKDLKRMQPNKNVQRGFDVQLRDKGAGQKAGNGIDDETRGLGGRPGGYSSTKPRVTAADEEVEFDFTDDEVEFDFTEDEVEFDFTEDEVEFDFTEDEVEFDFSDNGAGAQDEGMKGVERGDTSDAAAPSVNVRVKDDATVMSFGSDDEVELDFAIGDSADRYLMDDGQAPAGQEVVVASRRNHD